jgi:secondary thiamine-phosphate synthase enzyme
MAYRDILTYSTLHKAEFRTITGDLHRCVAASGLRDGTLLAYSLHTTMGLMIQETAESNLCDDMLDYLGFHIEDDGQLYRHRGHLHPRSNGSDPDENAPSHLRQMLVNQNLALDVWDGELVLGPWQDVAIVEFDGPREGRQVLVKLTADPLPSGARRSEPGLAGRPSREADCAASNGDIHIAAGTEAHRWPTSGSRATAQHPSARRSPSAVRTAGRSADR